MALREGLAAYIACDQLLTRHGVVKQAGWWLNPGFLPKWCGVPAFVERFTPDPETGVPLIQVVGEYKSSSGLHPALARRACDEVWLQIGVRIPGEEDVYSLNRASASVWRGGPRGFEFVRALNSGDNERLIETLRAVTAVHKVPITGHL